MSRSLATPAPELASQLGLLRDRLVAKRGRGRTGRRACRGCNLLKCSVKVPLAAKRPKGYRVRLQARPGASAGLFARALKLRTRRGRRGEELPGQWPGCVHVARLVRPMLPAPRTVSSSSPLACRRLSVDAGRLWASHVHFGAAWRSSLLALQSVIQCRRCLSFTRCTCCRSSLPMKAGQCRCLRPSCFFAYNGCCQLLPAPTLVHLPWAWGQLVQPDGHQAEVTCGWDCPRLMEGAGLAAKVRTGMRSVWQGRICGGIPGSTPTRGCRHASPAPGNGFVFYRVGAHGQVRATRILSLETGHLPRARPRGALSPCACSSARMADAGRPLQCRALPPVQPGRGAWRSATQPWGERKLCPDPRRTGRQARVRANKIVWLGLSAVLVVLFPSARLIIAPRPLPQTKNEGPFATGRMLGSCGYSLVQAGRCGRRSGHAIPRNVSFFRLCPFNSMKQHHQD